MTDYQKEFEEKLRGRLYIEKYASSSEQNFVNGARFAYKILETLLTERDERIASLEEAMGKAVDEKKSKKRKSK